MTVDRIVKPTEHLYYGADKNADNVITLAELIEGLATQGIRREDAIAAFEAADRDSDGNVTREEVEIRAREVGESQKNIAFMDVDGDGLVTDSDKQSYPAKIRAETAMSILSILSGVDNGNTTNDIEDFTNSVTYQATTAYASTSNNQTTPGSGKGDHYI